MYIVKLLNCTIHVIIILLNLLQLYKFFFFWTDCKLLNQFYSYKKQRVNLGHLLGQPSDFWGYF